MIDLLFLVLFIALLSVGYFQGVVRLGMMMLAFYLSLVLASLYFQTIGLFLRNQFHLVPYMADYFGFFIMLIFGFILLASATSYTFRTAHLPGKLQFIDHILGIFVGLLLAAWLLGIFAILLWNLMVLRHGGDIDLPIMRMIGSSVANSFTLRFLANDVLPQVYELLDPILPDAAAILFVVQ